jgi:lysophospholipase L1-like esterase
MKRRLLGGIAALILVLAGLFGSATAPAQAMTLPAGVAVHPYVALGDSFAAGYGLPAKGDPASVACSRSNLSYPELLNGFKSLKKLTFVACSGAFTGDLLSPNPATGDAPQLAALAPNAGTVTLTIGGNDSGFYLLGCLQDGSCNLDQIGATAAVALRALGGQGDAQDAWGRPVVSIVSLLAAIQQQAPGADIFITGYPELFGTSAKLYGTKTTCPVPIEYRTALNDLVRQLNSMIKASAEAARAGGIDVTYVGVAGAFDGHGLCDSRLPWISSQLHPTAVGQAAYAAALTLKGVTR